MAHRKPSKKNLSKKPNPRQLAAMKRETGILNGYQNLIDTVFGNPSQQSGN